MLTDTTCTYVIEEPFDRALRRLKKVLASSNLKISGELNISARIQAELMISLPPCVLLFASAPEMVQENIALDEYDAAMMPLHLVISARGPRTEVHFLKAVPRSAGLLQSRAFEAARSLQLALSRVLERIGRLQVDA